MKQNDPFRKITIEPAVNGYIVELETDETESKFVFNSLRITIREVKKMLKTDEAGDDE